MRHLSFSKNFCRIVACLILCSFLRVSIAAENPSKLLQALEEKIGQANILFYELKFARSEELLNEVITALKALPSSPAVNHDLSEAYLRLAITQNSLDKFKPMQESFYQSASYEPTRELKTGDFPPSVIAQFNKAKQKFLLTQNQGVSNSNLALQSSDLKKQKSESQPLAQKSEKKKSFFKSWPFFLILGLAVAGGAAGAAIALGGGGGGGSGGGSSGPVTVGGTPQ